MPNRKLCTDNIKNVSANYRHRTSTTLKINSTELEQHSVLYKSAVGFDDDFLYRIRALPLTEAPSNHTGRATLQ